MHGADGPLPIAELFAAWDADVRGPVVLTGTRRQALRLLRQWAAHCRERGRQAWRQPPVMSVGAFVDRAWQRAERAALLGGRPMPAMAGAELAELLWERAIEQDDDDAGALMPAADLARLAAAADRIVALWQLPLTGGDGREFDAYRRWRARYLALCAQHQVADASRRLDWCRAHAAALLAPGTGVVRVGASHWPPAWRALVDAIGAAAGPVRDLAAGVDGGTPRTECHASFDQECAVALHWAAQRLDAGQPAAIVVCGLDAVRERIEHLADRYLNPEVLQPGHAERARRYDLSGGWPLARHAMVDTALRLLALGAGSIERDSAGALLRSPYWVPDALRAAAAQVDCRLRELGLLAVDARRLAQVARHVAGAERLVEAFDALAADALTGRCGAAQWAERFAAWLTRHGLLRDRKLSSREYQAHQRWQDALALLAGLDPVLGLIDASHAVRRLARIAQRQLFQPQNPEAQVEILSWEEAEGLDLPAVRVIGLDDSRCPPPRRPNPLLPLALQRRAGVPDADPVARARAAAAQLAQLCRAPEVVLSCARGEGDQPLEPAAVTRGLADWPIETIVAVPDDPLAEALGASPALEQVEDGRAPAWTAEEQIRTGARLIGDQADCPFRAFAHARLRADTLPETVAGIPPAIRGVIVHRALHEVWGRLGGHDGLCAFGEEELAALVRECVDDAVASQRRDAPEVGGRLWQAEAERLSARILELLALERRRPPFAVVAREQDAQLEVAGLPLRLKIDRIDAVAGRRIVIDYKTGRNLFTSWASERPHDAQLPLYALAGDGTAGVAYACLAAGAVGFTGVFDDPELLGSDAAGAGKLAQPGQGRDRKLREIGDWAALVAAWRDAVEALAEEFVNGRADVHPMRGAASCRYCDLAPLCRIAERGAPGEDDTEDGAEEAS